jgi:hypothetical protein
MATSLVVWKYSIDIEVRLCLTKEMDARKRKGREDILLFSRPQILKQLTFDVSIHRRNCAVTC